MSEFAPKENNWLEKVVKDRSIEVYQKAMFGVFHRMRVVDRLLLSDFEINTANPDDPFVRVFLQEFIKKLYKTPLVADVAGNRFSAEVIALGLSNTFTIQEVGAATAEPEVMNKVVNAGQSSEANFIQGIESLKDKFDEVYTSCSLT